MKKEIVCNKRYYIKDSEDSEKRYISTLIILLYYSRSIRTSNCGAVLTRDYRNYFQSSTTWKIRQT